MEEANTMQLEPKAAEPSIAEIKAELVIAEAEAEAAALEELTPRQQAFIREYLLDFNGTQAAKRAGFSPKTAGHIAIELLQKPAIATAVARGQEELVSRNQLRHDVIVRELATLALSNINHYKITDEGEVTLAAGAPPNAMAAISSVDKTTTEKIDPKSGEITRTYNVKLKLWQKSDSLKQLGKHVGIASFIDRLEITGKDGGPIEIAAAKLTELPLEQLREKMLQLADHVEAEFTEVAAPEMEKAS